MPKESLICMSGEKLRKNQGEKDMDWKEEYKKKVVSMEEMAKQIKSGDLIGAAMAISMCTPDVYNPILDRAEELRDVTILDSVPLRPCKLYDPEFMATIDGHINYVSSFFSPGARAQGQPNVADFHVVSVHPEMPFFQE